MISARPAHPALVSEADFIAAQDASSPRGPAGPAARRYLLAGLLRCGTYGRRLESAWSNHRRPTGAATAIPVPPAPTRAGRKTPTSAKTRSCPTWPPWPSCSPTRTGPGPRGAGHLAGHGVHAGSGTDRPPAGGRRYPHLRPGQANSPDRHRRPRGRHRRPEALTLRRPDCKERRQISR